MRLSSMFMHRMSRSSPFINIQESTSCDGGLQRQSTHSTPTSPRAVVNSFTRRSVSFTSNTVEMRAWAGKTVGRRQHHTAPSTPSTSQLRDHAAHRNTPVSLFMPIARHGERPLRSRSSERAPDPPPALLRDERDELGGGLLCHNDNSAHAPGRVTNTWNQGSAVHGCISSVQDGAAGRVETRLQDKLQYMEQQLDLARDLSEMHGRSSKLYTGLNLVLVVPIILISSTAGAATLSGEACTAPSFSLDPDHVKVSTINQEQSRVSRMVLGIMGLVSAGLTTLQGLLRWGERATLHKKSELGFDKLARDIAVETLLTTTDGKTYSNMAVFMKACSERFNLLNDQSPSIPDHIVKRQQRVRLRRGSGRLESLAHTHTNLPPDVP